MDPEKVGAVEEWPKLSEQRPYNVSWIRELL